MDEREFEQLLREKENSVLDFKLELPEPKNVGKTGRWTYYIMKR